MTKLRILHATKSQYMVYTREDDGTILQEELIGYVIGDAGRYSILVGRWDEQEMAKMAQIEGHFATVLMAARAIAEAKIGR